MGACYHERRMFDLRTVNLLRAAAMSSQHFAAAARRIWRILRTLFHEVLAFTFFAFAALGGFQLLRVYRRFENLHNGDDVFRMVLLAMLVVMMSLCGISSFRSARRLSRNRD
jgi:uncharacterized membrane protein YraQ (UPF0718 family)